VPSNPLAHYCQPDFAAAPAAKSAIRQAPGADYKSALEATVALVANGPWP